LLSYAGIEDEVIDYRVPEESHYTVISSQPQSYYQTGQSYQSSPTPQYFHPGYQQQQTYEKLVDVVVVVVVVVVGGVFNFVWFWF
jgi:hypothetical protein